MTPADSYTTAEVAALAGVQEATIRQLHATGRMPAGQRVPQPGHGCRLIFPRSTIDAWLPTRPRPGRPRKVKA